MLKRLHIYFKEMYPIIPRFTLALIVFCEIYFIILLNNGIVIGTARVIESFNEIERLKEGDILITKFTDTGWTPKFAILSGIVTEYGGILCHAAIVSREYGIPAIVNCPNAIKKIKDGQKIKIDGSTGNVIIMEE